MSNIKLFESKQVRSVYNEQEEKWYFSITDVVLILTESEDALAYWRKLKQRLKAEGNETVTNCHALKMVAADGKMRMTDVANTEQLLRLIQSIPSPKAEPFKQWLAKVGAERIAEISKATFGIIPSEYKKLKGLTKTSENLRDHMTDLELIFTMLGEASTTEIAKNKNAQGFIENHKAAKAGGNVAGNARKELEKKSGSKIVSKQNFKDLDNAKELKDNCETS